MDVDPIVEKSPQCQRIPTKKYKKSPQAFFLCNLHPLACTYKPLDLGSESEVRVGY